MYSLHCLGEAMSSNNVTVKLTLDDNGTIKGKTAEAEKLNGTLLKVQKNAGMPKAAKVAKDMSESNEYGLARSAVGTGAESRDFAKQSRGLGGLVHLYATFAANIFAVSAAFTALSNAADTTNMIKGMDQLGAASGVALGSLAKKFSEVTDGAISTREAMEAVTKASSAGLSSKQTLDIASSAKKASQALGVDMSDAVSRLTRGISKLEPELLDELGIFTKVGKATEDYAKSIGKPVSALTDFQRRQAFANAVLAEAKDKFSEINIDANPYSKLLASLKDISYTGLNLVNNVLGPLVSYLGNSPTALASVLALVTSSLVSKAIPAIGQYRKGLEDAAKAQSALADTRLGDAKIARQSRIDAITQASVANNRALINKANEMADAAEDIITKKLAGSKIPKAIRSVMNAPVVTDDHIKNLEKLSDSTRKNVGKNIGIYKEYTSAIKAARTAQIDVEAAMAKGEAQKQLAPTWRDNTSEKLLQMKSDNAQRASFRKSIVSGGYESIASGGGIGEIFSRASKVMDAAPVKFGLVSKAYTYMGLAAASAAAKIELASAAIGKFLMVITIIVTVYEILNALLSDNGKAMSALNTAIEDVTGTVDTATKVNEKYMSTISIAAIEARSNALVGISDAMNSVAQAAADADGKTTGFFDRMVEGVKDLLPGMKSIEEKLGSSAAEGIKGQLKLIDDPAVRTAYENNAKQILGINDLTADSIEKLFDGLDRPEAVKLMKKLSAETGELSAKFQASAAPLKQFTSSLDTLNKDFQTLATSLNNSDPMSKFGASLINASVDMAKAFDTPTNTIASLKEIMKDTSKVRMFPQEAQDEILATARNVATLEASLKSAKDSAKYATDQIAKLDDLISGASGEYKNSLITLKVKYEADLNGFTTAAKAAQDGIAKAAGGLKSATFMGVAAGVKAIEAPIAMAIAKGTIDANKQLISFLPKSIAGIEAQAKLEEQSIGLRKTEITLQMKLINAIDLDRVSRERLALEQKADAARASGDTQLVRTYDKQVADLKVYENSLQTGKTGDLAKQMSSGEVTITPEMSAALQRMAGVNKQLAELDGQMKLIRQSKDVQVMQQLFDNETKKKENSLKAAQQALEQFNSDSKSGMSQAQVDAKTDELSNRVRTIQQELENRGIEKDIATSKKVGELTKDKDVRGAAKEAGDAATAQLATARGIQNSQNGINDTLLAQKRNIEEIDRTERSRLASSELTLATSERKRIVSESAQQAELQSLEYLSQTDKITADEYTKRKSIAELKLQDISNTRAIAQIEEEHLAKVAANNKLKEEGKLLSVEELAIIDTRTKAEKVEYENKLLAQEKLNNLKKEELIIQGQLTEAQKIFTQQISASASTFMDGFLAATKGAKVNFAEMLTQMLSDMADAEIKASGMNLLKGLAKDSGITSIFGSGSDGKGGLFGSGGKDLAKKGFDWVKSFFANGGAFDGSSVQKFASGGTFTNSVVSAPTLFKFAKGTGLMGEAGPEAIMPLKRGPNGSLGVVNHGAKQEQNVVVTNHFAINGPVDSRTQLQIANAASASIRKASFRNG